MVLPLGVDLGRFHPVDRPPPTGTLRVGFVGRLIPHKGVDVLLRAVALDDRFRADIFGSGPEDAALQALAAELGIVERKMGKFTDAESAYQRSIASAPDYAPAYLNLGVLYDLYLSEPQKALDQFEHYLQLAGENKQVSGWVVELRKRVGAGAPPAAKKDPA